MIKKCFLMIALFSGTNGCSDILGNQQMPSSVPDSKHFKNEAGAIELYSSAVRAFTGLYGGDFPEIPANRGRFFSLLSGLLSDELITKPIRNVAFPESFLHKVDARLLIDEGETQASGDMIFEEINKVRANISEARGVMLKYAPNTSRDKVAESYIFTAITELMLAELYCSGIPLTTVDFERNMTLTRGYDLSEVYTHIYLMLDSANLYVNDNKSVSDFLALVRARALLGDGKVQEAAEAVQHVETNFRYNLNYFPGITVKKFVPTTNLEGIADKEGVNGVPYSSSGDPRIALQSLRDPIAPLPIATGIEARLIEAEADLIMKNDAWLDKLNRLRTSCTDDDTCPSPAPAGEGGIAGLSLLIDSLSPGDTSALRKRLLAVFEERAYWLFLTGRRQGDMRRLIRNYGLVPSDVYPVGPYWQTAYGNYFNLPVPNIEMRYNPLYKGCNNRDM